MYVRVAENRRLQPGQLLCNVSVEWAPGQLIALPSNQIYFFGSTQHADATHRVQQASAAINAGASQDQGMQAAAQPGEEAGPIAIEGVRALVSWATLS